MTDAEQKLRAFAKFMLEDWPDSMPDEWAMQDKAIECGLLDETKQEKPCGDDCWCAEYHGADAFPVTCYRRSRILMGE